MKTEEYSHILRAFGKTQKPLTIEGRKIHQTTTDVRREYGCGDRHRLRRGPFCIVLHCRPGDGPRAEAPVRVCALPCVSYISITKRHLEENQKQNKPRGEIISTHIKNWCPERKKFLWIDLQKTENINISKKEKKNQTASSWHRKTKRSRNTKKVFITNWKNKNHIPTAAERQSVRVRPQRELRGRRAAGPWTGAATSRACAAQSKAEDTEASTFLPLVCQVHTPCKRVRSGTNPDSAEAEISQTSTNG